jgi:polysaccharide export outer membrane protein
VPRQPKEPETISVYVMGEANGPGKLEVEPGTTVLQMFAIMGGFTNFAATKRVQLRRTHPQTSVETVYTLSFDAAKKGSATNLQAPVADGDVIFVPQRRLFE